MTKSKRHIKVVPVWRAQVDRQLMVRALLAYVDQLANEANDVTVNGGPPEEAADD
jgi:hypothetical protein